MCTGRAKGRLPDLFDRRMLDADQRSSSLRCEGRKHCQYIWVLPQLRKLISGKQAGYRCESNMTDKEILKAFRRSRKKESEKKIIRPAFTLQKELLHFIIALFFCAVLFVFTAKYREVFSTGQYALLIVGLLIVFIVTQAKNMLLLLVFLYQRLAPSSVRSVCLFTPSCSEYMRLSILKYGVWKGLIKGLKRIRRCHPPNGGPDEP